MLAQEMMAATAPERERIAVEIGADMSDDCERRIVRYAQEYCYALFRVEFDFRDDPDDPSEPYHYDWLYAHRQGWNEATSGDPDAVRSFGDLCQEGRAEFHTKHPEWKAEHDRRAAEERGTLF